MAVRDVRRGAAAGRTAQGADARRPVAVHLRGERRRDPLHQRIRSRPARAATVQLSQARGIGADPARRRGRPRRADVAGQGPAAAGAGHNPVASGAGHRDPRGGAVARRPAPRSFAGADGHGRGQDVHSGDERVPAAEVRRVPADPVPSRPQQPRRPDLGGVPELPDARRWASFHRDLQRRQAHRLGHARQQQRRDLHDPARLQGASGRRGHRG